MNAGKSSNRLDSLEIATWLFAAVLTVLGVHNID